MRKSREFHHELNRILSHTYYRGADVGEATAAADRVKEGDYEGWFRSWNDLANQTAELAKETGEGYLRAANYLRQAIFFLRGDLKEQRIVNGSRQIQEWFRKGATLEPYLIEPVECPYLGYFARSKPDERRPLILLVGGYDSVAEELYFAGGRAALDRGYHCLFFDGPGQGHTLYSKGLRMRPDWEEVIGPVIDWATKQPTVDPEQIVLIGRSSGGYFAPRAASGESRLAGCVADPGQLSLIQGAAHHLPGEVWDRFCASDPSGCDREMERAARHNVGLALQVQSRMAAHGLTSTYAWLEALTEYTNEERAEKISCPTLVCRAEEEYLSPKQAEALFEQLACQKRLITFPVLSQPLFAARVFSWVEECLQSRVSV